MSPLEQGSVKCDHSPNLACHLFSYLFFFLNKVSWEYNHTRLFTYYLWWQQQRGEESQQTLYSPPWTVEALYRGAARVPGLAHNPQNYILSSPDTQVIFNLFLPAAHKNC